MERKFPSSRIPYPSTRTTSRPAITRITCWFRLVPIFLLVILGTQPQLSTTFSLKATTTSTSSTTGHSKPTRTPAVPTPLSHTNKEATQTHNNSNNKDKQRHQISPHHSLPPKPLDTHEQQETASWTTPAIDSNTSGKLFGDAQHSQTDNSISNDQEQEDEEEMQTPDDKKFKERILSSVKTVSQWDADTELLQACRKIIPWEELRNVNGTYSDWTKDRWWVDHPDALMLQRLARWFPKFMSWVNTPPCSVCGHKECEMKTIRGPETEEEQQGQAKRVEVYYCPECKANTTTFPRYNLAKKLLETKKGRCGEYSNLFGLFCRAAGFETRLVLDLSDHLWTEVRLGDSWVMADSCEGVIDKASMYEDGWGKDGLCYMIAIAKDHVVDVTPRYTRKFLSEDLQTRRRRHTTSENATHLVLQEINDDLQRNLTNTARTELARRRQLEDAELQLYKQMTEWTPQEKYGRGRISGSLAWKRSRQEDGKKDSTSDDKETDELHVAGFEVTSFSSTSNVSSAPIKAIFGVHPRPTSRHNGIIAAGTQCAIGEANSISVVVVDQTYLSCILQTQSFLTWPDVKEFVNRLPSHRIVLLNGKSSDKSHPKTIAMPRLGGWKANSALSDGITFIGQVDAHPDWSFFSTIPECPPEGYEVELQAEAEVSPMKLRTERLTLPRKVAGRLPETAMPLQTQLVASDEQKRIAFQSFVKNTSSRYSGYTTRPNAPVYLLDATAFPFSKMETTSLVSKEDAWNTFHYLPPPLVPDDDNGVISGTATATTMELPKFVVPLESNFFNNSIGGQLLQNSTTRLPTQDALHNSRLVGLYFSASWCGPCRSFTPMLAEMYEHLKDYRPSHGLEIVFVSSDRDQNSFNQYYGHMPWQAIPFENLQFVKQRLSMTYGVRGIPSLVILDAVSGQVVVSAQQSRQAVGMACRGGEQKIEEMFESWLQRTPQESKEILSMLELSCQEEQVETPPEEEPDNPYLLKEPFTEAPIDPAARIKEFFDQLVAEGGDPTASAAKAIGMVAEEQRSGQRLEPGPLNGRALRTGPPLANDPLDLAFAQATEWNSPAAVANVLQTATKYLKNARKEPWSTKFRSFKLSNKVADQITRVEGGLELLQALGFEVYGTNQDFKAMIPVSVDLEAMNNKISNLLAMLE